MFLCMRKNDITNNEKVSMATRCKIRNDYVLVITKQLKYSSICVCMFTCMKAETKREEILFYGTVVCL